MSVIEARKGECDYEISAERETQGRPIRHKFDHPIRKRAVDVAV